jgi:hypothetical protein
MIVIQGMFEGDIVAEERVADSDEMFVEAIVMDLYASGCDFVSVRENA